MMSASGVLHEEFLLTLEMSRDGLEMFWEKSESNSVHSTPCFLLKI